MRSSLDIAQAATLLPIAEMIFALYFSYFVWFALQHGQFISLPFLIMFQVGFLYVSLSSLGQWFPRISLANERAAATIPA